MERRSYLLSPIRCQFTLRTLLLVVALAAIVANIRAKRAENRGRAIAMIGDRGGEFFLRRETTGYRRWIAWLIAGGEPITRVDLWRADLSDADLALLSVLSDVERLDLAGAQLPRTWASHISRLKQLRHLEVDGSSICDGDLKLLPRLPQLRTLSLTDTRISDASITDVSKCRSLERVALDGGHFSEHSIDVLRRMPNLAIVTVTTSAD